jgi:hypothetical protein
MFTREQQNAAIAAAHFQQETERGLEQIFSAFPTLVRCEANTRRIQELCRDFMGEDVAPSLDTFRNFLDLNPDAWKSLVHRPVEIMKRQIIQDILSLLASKDNGRDGKFDSFNLRSEAKRMESWSLDALRNRLNGIRTRQKMAATDLGTLKAFVADAHAYKRRYPGYPELPRQVWNGTTHVPLNAAYIKALPSFELKKLVRLYSAEQVNSRLRGDD